MTRTLSNSYLFDVSIIKGMVNFIGNNSDTCCLTPSFRGSLLIDPLLIICPE
uniref:Uncharacterized protein n=1 Tax=Arion vulgaris TaxID=1028688 RepID=A0A0B7BUB8_9EUPU